MILQGLLGFIFDAQPPAVTPASSSAAAPIHSLLQVAAHFCLKRVEAAVLERSGALRRQVSLVPHHPARCSAGDARGCRPGAVSDAELHR